MSQVDPNKAVLTVALSAMLALAPISHAATGAPGGPGEAPEGLAVLATGPSSAADGYLDVAVDEYGSWASVTFGGGGDHFNPAGPFGLNEVGFSTAFYLFVPAASQRQALTENASILALGDDASLAISITSPLATSDTNGDAIDDTATSAFQVQGTGTDLGVDLTQRVASAGPGVAYLLQDVTVTNNGAAAITFSMPRYFDGDLVWSGDFSNDEVGTSSNGSPFGVFVVEQEVGDPATAMTLSSTAANAYYGGKHGVQPAGGPPPYDFGSDTELYDAFGVPASWVNHVAGVGYSTNGFSGSAPTGSTAPQDGFIGIGIPMTLNPGASASFSVLHTYGQATPASLYVPPTILEIPTLSPAGIALLALVLALFASLYIYRRRQA